MEVSCFVVYIGASLICISRGVPFQDVAKAGLKFGDEGIFQRSKDSFF